MRKTNLLICWCFLSGIAFGTVMLWVVSNHGPRPSLLVEQTHGQAYLPDEDVVLPGEPLEGGDQIIVGDTTIQLVDSSASSKIRLYPGSRLTVQWTAADPITFNVTISRGKGILRSDGTHYAVHVEDSRVELPSGALAWDLTGDSTFWSTQEIRMSPLNGDQKPIQGAPFHSESIKHFLQTPIKQISRKEQWYAGSLEPIEKIRNQMKQTANRNHRVPTSLRKGLGYWPRDRWGQVYLYQPTKNGFSIRSAGRDGKFFTADDLKTSALLPEISN